MRRRTAWLAAGVLSTLSIAPTMAPAQAATGCSVDYSVTSQWGGGFQGAVNVKNLGSAISSWTLKFTFPNSGQKVQQGWAGVWGQSGSAVTVQNESWNGSLATSATASLGFIGAFTSANPAPTSFQLNGVQCTGSVTTGPTSTPTVTPTVTPTTKPPTTPPVTTTPTTPPTTAPAGSAPALHVSGNKLVTASGAAYTLHGVNRSGGEFACIQGTGAFWDGPMDQTSVTAMRSWKIRSVRIPLNEECWLGTTSNPVAAYKGAAYQTQVKNYVALLIKNGITPIIDLHWTYGVYTGNSSGCASLASVCQKPMPDAQYAPAFWSGVASAFKGNDAVVFDLFNEPYPERATGDETSGWKCWRDGGTCPGIGYSVAGFQTLVNSVRATGASNVIMLGGLAYSNDLTQWLAYKPTDSKNNIIAATHIYNFNSCANTSCWDSQLAPVAAKVPLVIGEFGENDCNHSFVDGLMNWADAHSGVSYLGWTWNTWDCSTGPALISDYNGTATNYGQGLKARLASVSN